MPGSGECPAWPLVVPWDLPGALNPEPGLGGGQGLSPWGCMGKMLNFPSLLGCWDGSTGNLVAWLPGGRKGAGQVINVITTCGAATGGKGLGGVRLLV